MNPFSAQQLVLFFAWLVVFVGSSIIVVMADSRWMRALAWLVCAVSSFGLWQAGWITVTIAANHWQSALAVAGGTVAGSFWIARRRRR